MGTRKIRKKDVKKEVNPGINASADNAPEFFNEDFIDNLVRSQQEGELFDAFLRLKCMSAREFLMEEGTDNPESKAIAGLINTDHTFYRDITPEEVDEALKDYPIERVRGLVEVRKSLRCQ